MASLNTEIIDRSSDDDTSLFERICRDLVADGFSICRNALPPGLSESLAIQANSYHEQAFDPAGIGRGQQFEKNAQVRNDQILWIEGDSPVGQKWLDWTSALQSYINRRLFLGLFSFESHFAHYPPGSFYKRHMDAFKGQSNRILTLVTYLNHNWQEQDGGALKLYRCADDQRGITILPDFGTLVVFLSEDFPHEVLTTHRDRFSVAGWFRLNSSQQGMIDPPN